MNSLGKLYTELRPGAARRKALLEWMAIPHGYPGLAVNNRWQANLRDPDLRYLLKKGKVVRHRVTSSRRGGKGQTYLILT